MITTKYSIFPKNGTRLVSSKPRNLSYAPVHQEPRPFIVWVPQNAKSSQYRGQLSISYKFLPDSVVEFFSSFALKGRRKASAERNHAMRHTTPPTLANKARSWVAVPRSIYNRCGNPRRSSKWKSVLKRGKFAMSKTVRQYVGNTYMWLRASARAWLPGLIDILLLLVNVRKRTCGLSLVTGRER